MIISCYFLVYADQETSLPDWKFKRGDGFTIGLPRPSHPCKNCTITCTLVLPGDEKIIMNDFGNGTLTSFEFLPGRGRTCSFRIFPKELYELDLKNSEKYLGQYWTIYMEYDREKQHVEENFCFFMNTMAWLDEKGYNAVDVSHPLFKFTKYSTIKYHHVWRKY